MASARQSKKGFGCEFFMKVNYKITEGSIASFFILFKSRWYMKNVTIDQHSTSSFPWSFGFHGEKIKVEVSKPIKQRKFDINRSQSNDSIAWTLFLLLPYKRSSKSEQKFSLNVPQKPSCDTYSSKCRSSVIVGQYCLNNKDVFTLFRILPLNFNLVVIVIGSEMRCSLLQSNGFITTRQCNKKSNSS